MNTEDSVLSAITDSHLFKSLDDEGRQRLLGGARTVKFEAEQVVVREGDPGEALYVVKDGKVRVYTTQEGAVVQLATLGRGACFGEVALLSGRPRTATVVADGPCALLCFPRLQIEEVLEAYPKVRKLLETVVIGRARDTMRKLTRPITAVTTAVVAKARGAEETAEEADAPASSDSASEAAAAPAATNDQAPAADDGSES